MLRHYCNEIYLQVVPGLESVDLSSEVTDTDTAGKYVYLYSETKESKILNL